MSISGKARKMLIDYSENYCKKGSVAMPNLTNGRIIEGKLYCWDRDKKSFFLVELSPVNDISLLNTIVAALIEDKSEKSDVENVLEELPND